MKIHALKKCLVKSLVILKLSTVSLHEQASAEVSKYRAKPQIAQALVVVERTQVYLPYTL